jgi:NTP pyrophosphatase (non-canonical NTP hydrolase)
MNLNELAKSIHQDNIEKGFYDIVLKSEQELKQEMIELFIFKQLLLVISEVSEAVEYLRKNNIDYTLEPNLHNELTYQENVSIFEKKYKDTFQDEIGDAFIRLLDLVGYLGIDIESWIEAKLNYNKTRNYRHGKKY